MPSAVPPAVRPPAKRLVVWPLLAGVVVLLAMALGALGGALLFASGEADELADEQISGQLEAALAQQRRSLETSTIDWAWWDEAIERFVTVPNPVYAEENLGRYAHDVLGLSLAMIVNPDGGAGFAFLDGEALPPAEAQSWLEAVAPLTEITLSESTVAEPIPVGGFVTWGGDLHLVTVSAMAAEDGQPIAGWERQAVLLFGRRVDERFLDSLSSVLGLQHLYRDDSPHAARNALQIQSVEGEPIARLGWQMNYPGEKIVAELLPSAAGIALIMLLLVGLLLARALMLTVAFRRERERREAELIAAEHRASSADRAKSLFLANTSHELRTPLNAIIGFSETLRLEFFGALNDRQREYVSHIEEGGRHLLSVLQDVLDMARIESRREQLEEQPIVPAAIVERAFTLVEPLRLQQDIELKLIDGAYALQLLADERRLLQMLLNLLSNALSFSPRGSVVAVEIALESDAAASPGGGSGRFVITIRDQGPGLPDSELERVLVPFHRPPAGSSEGNRESNGLGLPLTSMLMGLHGGRLVLANAPGGGLAAALRFPPGRTLPARQQETAPPEPIPC